jgi:hypothetical protein
VQDVLRLYGGVIAESAVTAFLRAHALFVFIVFVNFLEPVSLSCGGVCFVAVQVWRLDTILREVILSATIKLPAALAGFEALFTLHF